MRSAAPRRTSYAACLFATAMSFLIGLEPARADIFPAFNLAVAETASSDEGIARFYRERNYEPLWTGNDDAERREALLRVLSQADAHGLPAIRYRPETLIASFRAVRGEREIGMLEVATTRLFLSYAQDIQSGALEPTQILPAEIKRELPRRDPYETLSALAEADSPLIFLRSLAPSSAQYVRLLQEKSQLERLVQNGGWGATVTASKLEPGDWGEEVVSLRNRLISMGYLEPSASASYDADLVAAVRSFQSTHGLTESGAANSSTIDEINRSAEDRLKSVLVALERERWMNVEGGLGDRHIWVNLVDFHARVIDEGKISFQTRAVVGERRPDKRTYEFSDVMEYLEVNPDWTVPRSILGRDYLPRMRRNPNAASYLQIIDRRGRVVPRGAIDFSRYTARNFPFTVRQAPGRRNALGVVKFMFPNPHAIYLHDTPQQELFTREQRDYSSGCIRLDDPHDMAYHLLSRQMDDPKSYFDDLVRSGRQTRVEFETPFPVHLVYYTAYSDAHGVMQYRRDIYGRDAVLFKALSDAGVAFPGAEG